MQWQQCCENKCASSSSLSVRGACPQGLAQRMLGEENVLRRWNPGKHTIGARRNTVHTNSSSDTPLKPPRIWGIHQINTRSRGALRCDMYGGTRGHTLEIEIEGTMRSSIAPRRLWAKMSFLTHPQSPQGEGWWVGKWRFPNCCWLVRQPEGCR